MANVLPAHHEVGYAVRTGRLIPQPCEVCGATKTDAHHDDYSKPLEVRWLCRTHHSQQHGRRGRRASEVCANGHVRTDANTYFHTKTSGRIVRSCRICRNAASARHLRKAG